MATLAQAHTFTPINLDENTIINNVSVSKIKAHQTPFVNHVSKLGTCNNNNNNNSTNNNSDNNGKPITRVNGATSPKPHTTSQNRPPKIKLLNRSVAVTQGPKDSNGPDDDFGTSDTELNEELSPKADSGKGKLNRTQSQDNSAELSPTSTCNSEKEKKQSTPQKYNAMSTPPKQSSFEYSSSPSSTTSSLNRENSLDYKDSTGVDLHEFMVKTLKENPRDRLMLLKLERDFTDFINDVQKMCYKYPPMTSYHRMLIHRVAAYFGLDHNVDSSGKSVVISKTPASRIPEVRFQSYCSREYTDEEISAVPKSILLRSSSSEEAVTPPRYESPLAGIDRRYGLEDKQGKSIEEREEDYNKAKERIFKRESLEMLDVVGITPPEGADNKSPRHSEHISPSADSTQSEKEAAIAAVAAATGNKTGNNTQGSSSSKRSNDRKNVGLLRFSSATQQIPPNWQSPGDMVNTPTEQYNYINNSYTSGTPPLPQVDGYQQAGAIPINPQAGQRMIGADGNPIYFQAGYHPQAASNIAYVANGNNPAYVAQQGQYVPYYYVSGPGQQVPTENPTQGQQYYIMQAAQPGPYVYMPQSGVPNQSPASSPIVLPQQHSNTDYNAQMQNLTLNDQSRRGSLAREDLTNKSQPSTPTSPVDASPVPARPSEFPAQSRQVFYLPNGRPVQTPVYDQNGYPVQMYHGVPYAAYPLGQDPSAASNSTAPPNIQHRAPTPNILPQHYGSVQNPRPTAPQPSAQPQVRGPTKQNNPRLSFLPGLMPNPRATNPAVYLPVANGNQAAMLIAGQYANVQMNPADVYSLHDAYRHTEKNNVCISDNAAAEYQKLTQNMQARNLIQVNQHRGPIIQIQPTYQTYQAYITPQRFVANQSYNKQPVWNNNSSHRKHRNARNQNSNQQIRISRPNSSSNDADQKTVSHILEIYEFPATVTSDADAIFDEIKSCGARILKINSSSSQSLNNAHGGGANQKPTILAIFKSAGEAQRALETVTSPYYKLRVSQKSPTHFAGGDCQSSTLGKNSN